MISRNRRSGPPNQALCGYYHPTREKWWEETVHAPVVMHDWKQQKQLEATIRELVQGVVEQARREGYEQGYAEGKRTAVN